MNMGEILIWEAINVLLLIPPVMALVMLTRWIRGRFVFTDRDWLFLVGYNREKALSLRLWLRFVKFWFAVVFVWTRDRPLSLTLRRRLGCGHIDCRRRRCFVHRAEVVTVIVRVYIPLVGPVTAGF